MGRGSSATAAAATAQRPLEWRISIRSNWTRSKSDASSAGRDAQSRAAAGRAVPGVEVDVEIAQSWFTCCRWNRCRDQCWTASSALARASADIVVRQPGQRLDTRASGRRQVAVAAVAGLFVQKLEAAAELALPPHAEERPEPEDVSLCRVPRRLRHTARAGWSRRRQATSGRVESGRPGTRRTRPTGLPCRWHGGDRASCDIRSADWINRAVRPAAVLP